MERMEFAKGIQSKALGKLGSKFPAYQTLVSIAFLHFALRLFLRFSGWHADEASWRTVTHWGDPRNHPQDL